jgi:hypothetical protein
MPGARFTLNAVPTAIDNDDFGAAFDVAKRRPMF